MLEPFRFFVAGDWRLDLPPGGLTDVPGPLAAVMREAARAAVKSAIDAALKAKVDFVLLAGDVVDPQQAGAGDLTFIVEQFKRLGAENIPLYWASAAAPKAAWPENWPLPENVSLFPLNRPRRIVAVRGDAPLATIIGASGDEPDVAAFRRKPSDPWAIAIGHGDVDPDALDAGLDAWVLGGGSAPRAYDDQGSFLLRTASLQGRSHDEPGPHGGFLVEVDERGRRTTKLIENDSLRYVVEHLQLPHDVAGDALPLLLQHHTEERLKEWPKTTLLVQFVVSGTSRQVAKLVQPEYVQRLVEAHRSSFARRQPAVYCTDIQPRLVESELTNLVDSGDGYAATMRDEFLRRVERLRSAQNDKDAAIDLAGQTAKDGLTDAEPLVARLSLASVRSRVLRRAAVLGAGLLAAEEAHS